MSSDARPGTDFVRRQLFRRVFPKAGRQLAMFPVVSVLFPENPSMH